MPVEPLSSNVVNYLVWRYLQESGFGNAAVQLSRSWYHNPDRLPFAKHVSSHALIHILQDGLWFDKLQAEVKDGQRRYQFGRDHGRPFSLHSTESSMLDQQPPPDLFEETNGTGADAPARRGPTRKKQKKTNGIVDRQVNGDAMDIDHNGSLQITPSLRGESEAVVSDAESPSVVEEIPISTLSIGQSTYIQTEEHPPWENEDPTSRGLESGYPPRRELNAPQATNLIAKEPDKEITHTLWDPSAPLLLLTGGKSLARLQDITDLRRSLNFQIPLNDFSVTAVCFTSNEEVAIAAREEHINEQGDTMKTDKLIKVIDAGRDSRIISSVVGMVSTLRWNPSSRTLLSVSTTDMAGSIKIWTNDDTMPAFTAFAESAIMDAAWMTETEFVVCGLNLVQVYQIDGELKLLHSFKKEGTWETVKYDPMHRIIICAAFEEELMGVIYLDVTSKGIQTTKHPDKFFSGMELSSLRQPAGDSGRAPCFVGTCAAAGAYVWDVGDSEDPFREYRHFAVPLATQARCLAFSNSGELVAVGTKDSVLIWKVVGGAYEVKWLWTEGSDLEQEQEQNLSWNHDDSMLAFSIGGQVAVINLQE
ncbi:uncharacterized protein BDZ99DRAFT_526429 [Mytilinidion resinicola]|uniref:WD40 repeat-like protein n=1 Tax=Mytilinidion resinicola TaxID=574789 RepID=A0A6A6Y3Z6_9PEZI|nr:uncharacterized protein BDZ99DRAFT_526429 [Mytilinidion resinicola]KAF2803502.1 hypothetical protein BDZ99DRAFT_526429 [Mytilinidion resinicola]